MDRRAFLKGAAVTAGAALPLQALLARAASDTDAVRRGHTEGYGPLFETLDMATGLPLVKLPRGFKYVSFGWTGDPLSSGQLTPGAHDGMAAFDAGNHRVRLVRNHERGRGTPFSGATYDPQSGGGTTTLDFNTASGEMVAAYDSLSGTVRNCAGGLTPWGTWLTAEESNEFHTKPHGYIFEVPSDGTVASALPIPDMGRFTHEAVAVDPVTGYVYETEDAGSSGFYRFVPNTPGHLTAGGKLWMLKVKGVHQANLNTAYKTGDTFDVEWVQIDTPNNPASNAPSNFVYTQGRNKGGARFARLEGCWTGANREVYIVSTSGGGVGMGQVWVYDPIEETIALVFESPSADVLNAPDNICVSPRGGLVLCEDGSREGQMMLGLTPEGQIFPFAANNVVLNGEKNGITGDFRDNEWAGACFSPDGKWLFANLQSPGITVAITGPWKAGAI